MRLRFIPILCALLVPAVAHAARPSTAEAKAAYDKWDAELDKDHPEGAPALTSTPFQIAVFDASGQDETCEVTVTDRAKLADALACVKAHAPLGISKRMKPWSKKWLKKLPKQMEDYKAELTRRARTETLLVQEEEGEDVYEFAVVAVVKETDGTVRIAAVFSYYLIS